MSDQIKMFDNGDKVRINLWISRSMFDFLQYVASRDGRTMSDIVRESVRNTMIRDKTILGDAHGDQDTARVVAEQDRAI